MDSNKPHILVVADEMGPRESLKMILNPHYTVHVAERGGQAVDFLKKFPVDLVTLDLKIPGYTGINVLECAACSNPWPAFKQKACYLSLLKKTKNLQEKWRLRRLNGRINGTNLSKIVDLCR